MNRHTLRELVDRHAAREGVTDTPIEGLRLFRVTQPVERLPAIYPPTMCCVVQGSKRAYLNGTAHSPCRSKPRCHSHPQTSRCSV